MIATSVMRFVVLGAVGFGIGVLIAGAGFLIPVGVALGGASLGLAMNGGFLAEERRFASGGLYRYLYHVHEQVAPTYLPAGARSELQGGPDLRAAA